MDKFPAVFVFRLKHQCGKGPVLRGSVWFSRSGSVFFVGGLEVDFSVVISLTEIPSGTALEEGDPDQHWFV
jgi:hypothetical protein